MRTDYEDENETPGNCVVCGMPLLEQEGVRREIGGYNILFCSRNCMGLYFQREQAA